jgi:hypothetical protein
MCEIYRITFHRTLYATIYMVHVQQQRLKSAELDMKQYLKLHSNVYL